VKPEFIDTQARCLPGGPVRATFWHTVHILQYPGYVIFEYEGSHLFRIVPLDGRPHASADVKLWMGDSRGHWEGNVLVVETTNYIGGRNGVGVNGNGVVPYSDDLKTVERFTRTSDNTIDYEMRVTDPRIYTAPWTVAFTMKHEPKYQIFEYACHEGNYAMRNRLSAARAEEAAEAKAAAK
jgi:hypothetical protein